MKGGNVIAAVARNAGGPAGFVLQLEITLDDGKKLTVVTDDSWQFASRDPKDLPGESAKWMTEGLTAGKKPVVVGKMGDGPWGNVFGGGGSGNIKCLLKLILIDGRCAFTEPSNPFLRSPTFLNVTLSIVTFPL